jgi:hypothetical protein
MAMKNASVIVVSTAFQFVVVDVVFITVLVVSNVIGTMSNVVRYNGTGTKQKKVRIPTIAEYTMCIPNAKMNICAGV